MHLDMRVVETESSSEKDSHTEEPINLQPPLGSLGPSLAWESQGGGSVVPWVLISM